ncbi:MAG: type II toxin-antitoxin system antitoxin SocA domain-containing protein [Patescibacteria group bacterium]|jgi:transcriptional regulator with XRE-family HTH domain
MAKEYFKMIRKIRMKKGISQEKIATKIGVSRSSYIAFEQGKIELDFSQMARIADLFGISLEQVESGLEPDYEKYKQMILAYLRSAAAGDGKIPKTKLAKLLYLADFSWFYERLESMSGMQYRRIQFGPVPDMYFRAIDELEESGKISIDHKNEIILISENRGSENQALDKLSKDEKKLIEKISSKWKDKKTSEIVLFTHNQIPYKICRPDEIIPYELIVQEDPDYVY